MNICVFAGSAPRADVYHEQIYNLGKKLASAGNDLVFGGMADSLMKAIADGFVAGGGKVYGIVPGPLDGGNVYQGCTTLYHTDSLSERKEKMVELSDVFLTVPGGVGTLDELFDVVALEETHSLNNRLGLKRQVFVYNLDGYYDSLIAMLQEMLDKGFLYDGIERYLTVIDDEDELVSTLSA